MASTIVVGLDGSPGSVRALEWAARLGARVHATVQPVMAWDYPALALLPFPAGMPVPPVEAMQADAEVRAHGLVDGASGLGDLDIAGPLARQGSAGRVLCDAAASADLLVVGSRGLGSVKGVLLGSVSAHCANAAPCPVAIVPDVEPGALGTPDSHSIVVGVDGSALSDAAVAWADAWAPPDATLRLVHVWDIPVTIDNAAFVYDPAVLEEAADELLAKAAAMVSRHEVDVWLIRGDARVELERLARSADMMVIGARDDSVVERLLMGSVTSHVIHHVTTPTVIVRPTAND